MYKSLVVQAVGAVTAKAESLREEECSALSHKGESVRIAEESSGVFGLHSLASIEELERKLRYLQTGKEKVTT